MEIQPSHIQDLPMILQLYEHASALQASKGMVVWPRIDTALVEQEILNSKQWKLLIEGQPACVWVITEDDPLIWGPRNNEPSLYLHRIATAPAFRGQHLVRHVIEHALALGTKRGKRFIRLDTVGTNPGLIKHYTTHGFTFLGEQVLASTEGLPGHYNDGPALLFEMRVSNVE